jgi:hypothetical protein
MDVAKRQKLAKMWLIRNDPEAHDFWRSQPEGTDFVAAVEDNIRDFGPDETGMAELLVLQ